jgi:superfamily II DNA or RNA helicase
MVKLGHHNHNCSDEIGNSLVIPRGGLEKLKSLAKEHSMEIISEDQRHNGKEIEPVFHCQLTAIQQDALETLLENDYGILAEVPGFGKTVVSAALLVKRKVNTLIVVHRLQLLEQWIEKLSLMLGISKNEIGQIGGGKNRITGAIDIAMIQSLNGKSGVKALITQYGQVIVDECHHIAAYSFEKVLKHIRAKFVLGLTATPVRKDGLHPIIEMQCGPIRYRVNAKNQSKVQTFKHILFPRQTSFKSESADVQKLFTELVNDQDRNDLIFNDVLKSLEEKRKPMIIIERVAHSIALKERFAPFVKQVVVLSGQGKKSERKHELQYLADLPSEEECLVVATGKYIGEGFDDSRLDTLFLVMPISWKGTLEQYVGRLHREHLNKNEVRVYDYVDLNVPVLNKMYQKRLKGYRSMGYVQISHSSDKSEQMRLF